MAEAPAAAAEPALTGIAEWYEVTDDASGGKYYYNHVTGVSQWSIPSEPYVALPPTFAAAIKGLIRAQALFRGHRERHRRWVESVAPETSVPPAQGAGYGTGGAGPGGGAFTVADDDDGAAGFEALDDLALDYGVFTPGATCTICSNNTVDYASFPCACNLTCYDCYEKERETSTDDAPFHCPVCMKEVEEMVHQHDHQRLQHWANKFREAEITELLDRGEPTRRWGAWQAYTDPESGETFYFCAKNRNLLWEKPAAVIRMERSERLALKHDEYAYENLGKRFDESAWVKPAIATAMDYRKKMVFEGGRAPICGTRPGDMAHMGAGVTLYFRALKYFAILFFIMTLAAAPSLYMFRKSERIPLSDPNPFGIAFYSVGNLGTRVDNILLQPNETQAQLFTSSIELEGEQITYLISAADFFNSVLFLLFILYLRIRVSGVVARTSRKIVSVADYSILVRNLPPDATLESVRQHFDQLFRLDCDGVAFLKDHVAAVKAATSGRVAPQAYRASAAAVQPAMPSGTDNAAADVPAHPPTKPGAGTQQKAPQPQQPASQQAPDAPVPPVVPADEIVHLPAHHLEQSFAADDAPTADEVQALDPTPAPTHVSDMSGTQASLMSLPNAIESPSAMQDGSQGTGQAPRPRRATDESASAVAPAGAADGVSATSQNPGRRSSLPVPRGAKALEFDGTKRRLSIYGQETSKRVRNSVVSNLAREAKQQRPEDKRNKWRRQDTRMNLSGTLTTADTTGPVFRPVEDVAHVEDESVLGSWVADVQIVRPIGPLIRKYRQQTKLLTKLRSARATVKKYATDTPFSKGPNKEKRDKAMKKTDHIFYQIEKLRNKLHDRHASKAELCHGAFVTFNNEESYVRCLKEYRHSRVWWRRKFQAKHLRFGFEHPLNVAPAPDPSDVIWENLDTGGVNKWFRKQFTAFVALLLIILSFALILTATLAQERFAELIPDLSMCETELPAAFFGGYTNATAATFAVQSTSTADQVDGLVYSGLTLDRSPDSVTRGVEDVACGSSRYHLTYRTSGLVYNDLACDANYAATWAAQGGDSSSVNDANELSGGGMVQDVACPDPRRPAQCPCVDPTSVKQCRTVSCFKPELTNRGSCREFTASTITGCYCLDKLQRYVKDSGEFSGLKSFVTEQQDICGEWAGNYVLAQVLTASAAGAVSVVNRVIDGAMNYLVAFERHKSVSEATYALTAKSFLAQFINTAIIALLVSARLPNNHGSPLEDVGVLAGEHEDFTAEWYSSVGITFILVVVLDTLSHNGVGFAKYAVHRCMRLRAKKEGHCVTQSELNSKFVGPMFSMSERLSQQMVTIFVVLFFSSGLPLMLPLGLLFCVLTYWTDKFLLLRFYRKPPRVDGSLMQFMIRCLPFALMAHLGVCVWMFGNPDLLASEDVASLFFGEGTEGRGYFDEWTETGGDYDVVGVVPRIIRMNTAPHTILLLVMIAYYVFKSTAGSVLKTLFNRFCCCLKCAKFKGPKRKWTSAFTAEFAKLMDDEGQMFELRSKLSKYSARQRGYRKLTKLEYRQGWRIEDRDGLPVLRKVWNTTMHYPHDVWGRSHEKHDHKRTWEVIGDHGLYTYAMHANPEYKPVVNALKESKFGEKKAVDSGADTDSASSGSDTE